MPRYSYNCLNCDTIFQVFHGMNEEVEKCENCGSTEKEMFKRVYDKINVKSNKPEKTTAKQRVNEFIEEARTDLEDQKRESRKDHD